MLSKTEILKAHRVEAERRITLAQRRNAELSEEKRNALDLDDTNLFEAIVREIHRNNDEILNCRAAIKSIDDRLAVINEQI